MHFKHVIRSRAPALLLLLAMLCSLLAVVTAATDAAKPPSDQQIDGYGGTTTSSYNDGVEISKTIEGTDIENVFDITLTVTTQINIAQITQDPDLAVVIVMDISNTMASTFGDTTRYEAAMTAAENFIGQFVYATQNSKISKLGFVAFNTSAHKIFDLQKCKDQSQADTLKSSVRTHTGNIINASGYASGRIRFTNIEAGLKLGQDMLNSTNNTNKFIIINCLSAKGIDGVMKPRMLSLFC